MKKPILSFVIPVYKKTPEIFRECLKRIADSSLKEIEVICVFDGEDAPLQMVCSEFNGIKTKVIEHAGACKARNEGLKMTSGKYVVFWDSDCYIKPHAAKRWIEEFDSVPEADFVYTGYELTGERGEFASEPFNAYSLQCGNYISTMSPIKREKAFEWDESIPAAQDWDYWLTATEKGLKGVFIEGSGFIVDSVNNGISSEYWSIEKREETIARIKNKHNIPVRTIGVYSLNYREMAIRLAKILNADYVKPSGTSPSTYGTIFNLGYSFMSRFEDLKPDVVKIQYWLPGEIAGLFEAKYSVVTETIRISKTVNNWCGTEYEKNKLEDLGIMAQVVPLPVDWEDMDKISRELPGEFSVLLMTDDSYAKLLEDIEIDLPHIKFGRNSGMVKDYSCVMSFFQFAALDNPVMIAHLNGRHVISNIQAPYCGFIDPDQSWDSFKKDLYERIRIVSSLPINKEAQDYYKSLADPALFMAQINGVSRPVLEVL